MDRIDLSKRLISIADMVTPGNTFCDVGCDHGFLALYLVQERSAPYGIASDIGVGPLSAAKEHIFQMGYEDVIDLRLSDGLEKIAPFEAKSLIIAGMGGPLALKILETHRDVTDSFEEIIVSPQSMIKEFRLGLLEGGYKILKENMVYDEGKYYLIMKIVSKADDSKPNNENFVEDIKKVIGDSDTDFDLISAELEANYGKYLIAHKNKVFVDFLLKEKSINERILVSLDKEKHKERFLEISRKNMLNRIAYDMCMLND